VREIETLTTTTIGHHREFVDDFLKHGVDGRSEEELRVVGHESGHLQLNELRSEFQQVCVGFSGDLVISGIGESFLMSEMSFILDLSHFLSAQFLHDQLTHLDLCALSHLLCLVDGLFFSRFRLLSRRLSALEW